MTSGRIVRVLWGDNRPGCRWAKVWRKDVEPALRREEPCPFVVYCYGRRNADILTRSGVSCELVDPDPFPDGKADWDNGTTMVRPWHYKHQLITAAARESPVIYIDWDVSIITPESAIAFELLADRKRALSLYTYRRARPLQHRTAKRDRRLAVSGNWIYTADHHWPNLVLQEMAASEGLAGWHDEYAMTNLVDRLWGGKWMGEAMWLYRFESPVMVQKNSRCPWPLESSWPSGSERALAIAAGSFVPDRITRRTPVLFSWTKLFAQ